MSQTRYKNSISFRLSPEALEVLDQTAKRLGISKTGVVEIAIRQFSQNDTVIRLTPQKKVEEEE